MSLKIKICGITDSVDALAAAEAGADALGFMFYKPSPRYVSIIRAGKIIAELPPLIARVGVFVDAAEELIQEAISECGLDTLQFHGQEPPEFCRKFALRAIKAFRVQDAELLVPLLSYQTEAWL